MVDYVSKVYKNSKRIKIDDHSKIVLMSDCHRGNGDSSDNHSHNENVIVVALQYYYKNNFTYIELGDGDELWENKTFQYICNNHQRIFRILMDFYTDRRLHLIYGNHDMIKKNAKWIKSNYYCYCNESLDKKIELFPELAIDEGIVLQYKNNDIILLHGHQVDFLNYNLWQLSKFLVRYIWRPLEAMGFNDPTSPAKSLEKKGIVHKRLEKWANKESRMVISGHTHKIAFPDVGESLYFNDGCCIYPYYISAIEINNGEISLVKWFVDAKDDGTLYIRKFTMKGPNKLGDYFK